MNLNKRIEMLNEAESFSREVESRLQPLEKLTKDKPIVFISIGGGELGDLVVTAARRWLGGINGGVKTVVFDRYYGCPAQDSADSFECFDMLNGDALEEMIKRYVSNPSRPHVIFLEIERVDTVRVCKLGIEEGYNVVSTPFGPLICMDRYLTKLMFEKLNLPTVEWAYAASQREIEEIAKKLSFPIIVKPVMTSSGHGTSIIWNERQLEGAYEYSVKHARGKGDEVIVERYLKELKEVGTEITQIAVRHFNEEGKIVTSVLPPIEHKRPGATYHESWLPATISEAAKRKCQEYAIKIAEFIGGLGVFAVEQFVIGNEVYNSEVANRPHDTGMITRWMLPMDEGAIQLYSTLGLRLANHSMKSLIKGVYGVAHVILAPKFKAEVEANVIGWKLNEVMKYGGKKGYNFDVWYFGKPTAYPGRRMGLAVAFHEELEEARAIAEDVAHYAEKCIEYEGF